eukprot:673670-Rhodomonas_salina.3
MGGKLKRRAHRDRCSSRRGARRWCQRRCLPASPATSPAIPTRRQPTMHPCCALPPIAEVSLRSSYRANTEGVWPTP